MNKYRLYEELVFLEALLLDWEHKIKNYAHTEESSTETILNKIDIILKSIDKIRNLN